MVTAEEQQAAERDADPNCGECAGQGVCVFWNGNGVHDWPEEAICRCVELGRTAREVL